MHYLNAQASLAVRKVMAELKLLGGPLGHLEIGRKIGQGGFGVVHAGEGAWPGRGVTKEWGGGEVGGAGRCTNSVGMPTVWHPHVSMVGPCSVLSWLDLSCLSLVEAEVYRGIYYITMQKELPQDRANLALYRDVCVWGVSLC